MLENALEMAFNAFGCHSLAITMSDEQPPPQEEPPPQDPSAAQPVEQVPPPPPQELTWDSTLRDFLEATYTFSPELVEPQKPPRFIRLYADRWQVNWQLSGIPDPEAQSIVDITISARPVAPATIVHEV
jgi:hypothetical protein